MPPRGSIRTFLIRAKSALRTVLAEGRGRADFVIGNESADLDSLTSSLLYAYVCSTESKSYIPVVNIPADDVRLRPEFAKLLAHAQVDSELLITLDDLPKGESAWRKLMEGIQTSWTLVDHNKLQGLLGTLFESSVVAIIDHHAEESRPSSQALDRLKSEGPHVITASGSCSSLVTEYVRERWTSQEASQEGGQQRTMWDAELAKLPIASILIDTTNFIAKRKVTDHDMQAIEFLEAKVRADPELASSYDRIKLFEEIKAAKEGIGKLSVSEILRKDYKQWQEGHLTLGISSVVKPIDWLIRHAAEEEGAAGHLLTAINQYGEARGLDIFVLMTAFVRNDDFQRELLTLVLSENGQMAIGEFDQTATTELGLEQIDLNVSDQSAESARQFPKIWKQRNTQYSRKRVAPLMREAMQASLQKS